MPSPNHIAPDKLARLVGTPASPTIIDVRTTDDGMLVPGSIRLTADDIERWSSTIHNAAIVIDEDGRSGSQGVAAWLRTEGIASEVLEGGIAAWRSAALPLLDIAKLPRRDSEGGTVWVTRSRPKVDRIACPWLIRRFIDPRARFLFAPASDVLTVAKHAGATPFDVAHDDVFWSHREERCTFDLMVSEFGLTAFPGLEYLSSIVRGADTGEPDLVPEAAGLLAVSLGLSRMHADDLEQLEDGMLVYDALYRWCRDARSETHDWTSHAAREVRT